MSTPAQIGRLPNFQEHRSIAGAAAADAALPGFVPVLDACLNAEGLETLLFYWTATAETMADTIVFEPLFHDEFSDIWVRQPPVTLAARTIGEIPCYSSSRMFLRISGVAGAGASTGVKIRVAGGLRERRE